MEAKCEYMCPLSEVEIRINTNTVHRMELEAAGGTLSSEQLKYSMIKQYRRSAGDAEYVSSEDIRTPRALLQTIEFIERTFLNKVLSPSPLTKARGMEILHIYLFIFDRFRMILKDLSLGISRSISDSICKIDVTQKVISWLIYLGRVLQTNLSIQTEYYQLHHAHNCSALIDALKLLRVWYCDIDVTLATSLDERYVSKFGEYMAYYLIFCLSAEKLDVTRELRRMHSSILSHVLVRFATMCSVYLKCGNYVDFFREVALVGNEYPLLGALLDLLGIVEQMRLFAIIRWSHSYLKGSLYPLDDLNRQLHFDTSISSVEFLSKYGLQNSCPEMVIINKPSLPS